MSVNPGPSTFTISQGYWLCDDFSQSGDPMFSCYVPDMNDYYQTSQIRVSSSDQPLSSVRVQPVQTESEYHDQQVEPAQLENTQQVHGSFSSANLQELHQNRLQANNENVNLEQADIHDLNNLLYITVENKKERLDNEPQEVPPSVRTVELVEDHQSQDKKRNSASLRQKALERIEKDLICQKQRLYEQIKILERQTKKLREVLAYLVSTSPDYNREYSTIVATTDIFNPSASVIE